MAYGIMVYGSTPYVGMTPKKILSEYAVYYKTTHNLISIILPTWLDWISGNSYLHISTAFGQEAQHGTQVN